MKTCEAQSREPAPEILETIHRLFTERPPTPDEEGLLQQIQALEGRFGLGIHSGGGLPAGPVTPWHVPAMTRTEQSVDVVAVGISLARIGWYSGFFILSFFGKFSHSWHISNVPPVFAKFVL